MCGITGILNYKNFVDEKILRDMNKILFHRGPDDEGYFMDKNIGLAMRRLSIIDIQGGHQPIHNEDKSIWIVFNGEIYNYLELKQFLEKKGHKFYTNSDTEVIVHLYEDYDEISINYLNGMFAFALWDKKKEKLFLARDRLGIKPLFYTISSSSIIFASEIKSLLKHPEVKKEINVQAIDDYFTFLYIPSSKTIFKNIHKLPPAHYLTFTNTNNINLKRYWNINFDIKRFDENILSDELEIILKETIKSHLVSDVEVGALLSGGLDSSSVVCFMKEFSSKFKTFSIGFDVKTYDELKYARAVANYFGTEHYEFELKPNVVELLPKIIYHLDEPFNDASAIPTYLVSEMARKYLKVVLSGDGGDEIFGGYTWTRKQVMIEKYKRITPKFINNTIFKSLIKNYVPTGRSTSFFDSLKRFIYDANISFSSSFLRRITCYDKFLKEKIYSKKFIEDLKEHNPYNLFKEYIENKDIKDNFDRLLFTDTSLYLPDDILLKVDRMSMANSLEVRPPLLDYKLVEFCANIPFELKIKNFKTKYIFKKIMSKKLPRIILKQRKQGFSVPIGEWLRKDLNNFCKEVLLSNNLKSKYFFDRNGIEYIIKQHQSGNKDFAYQIWGLLIFEIWTQKYL